MDGKFYALKDEFTQLPCKAEVMKEFTKLDELQQSCIFYHFEYDELLLRVRNFYNSIEGEENRIILSHELLDKQSIIEVTPMEIRIEKMESNMLLPLLKRLYRHHFVIEVS